MRRIALAFVFSSLAACGGALPGGFDAPDTGATSDAARVRREAPSETLRAAAVTVDAVDGGACDKTPPSQCNGSPPLPGVCDWPCYLEACSCEQVAEWRASMTKDGG